MLLAPTHLSCIQNHIYMFHMDYPVVHTVGQMEMDIGYLYTDGKRNHKTATRPEPSLGQIGLHRNLSHRIFPASHKYSHNTGLPHSPFNNWKRSDSSRDFTNECI